MTAAYLNEISVAVPEHDIHREFIGFALSAFRDARESRLFQRMAARCQIDHRYSCVNPRADPGNSRWNGFYAENDFPGTDKRMKFYQKNAFLLAQKALVGLLAKKETREKITHLIVTSCTGFYAPGIDHDIIRHYKLKPSVERTLIGFMGCYAGVSALKTARHIVRSDKSAQVLIVNLELCTLHLQETEDLEQMLSFLIFADGCSASLVSSVPAGLELQDFNSVILPGSDDLITWSIGGSGFDMRLSGEVPAMIAACLPDVMPAVLNGAGTDSFSHWAIHPGGRTILDAVRDGLGIDEKMLSASRSVLCKFGNMSSASIMFVLKEMMRQKNGRGCGMAFGPGLSVESMIFQPV